MSWNRDRVYLNPTYRGQPITVLTGAAAYTTDPIDVGPFIEAILFINSTAHSGTTPTLDCKIQYATDETKLNWVDSGDTITQITTTDSITFKRLTANFGKWIRLVFTLGGTTPSYTFVPTIAAKS